MPLKGTQSQKAKRGSTTGAIAKSTLKAQSVQATDIKGFFQKSHLSEVSNMTELNIVLATTEKEMERPSSSPLSTIQHDIMEPENGGKGED